MINSQEEYEANLNAQGQAEAEAEALSQMCDHCTCLDYTMVGGKAICQRCNKEKVHPDIEIFKGAYIERNDAYNKSKEEVERLMVLLEKMVYYVWSYLPYKGNMGKTQYWEDFKKDNNITPV